MLHIDLLIILFEWIVFLYPTGWLDVKTHLFTNPGLYHIMSDGSAPQSGTPERPVNAPDVAPHVHWSGAPLLGPRQGGGRGGALAGRPGAGRPRARLGGRRVGRHLPRR